MTIPTMEQYLELAEEHGTVVYALNKFDQAIFAGDSHGQIQAYRQKHGIDQEPVEWYSTLDLPNTVEFSQSFMDLRQFA